MNYKNVDNPLISKFDNFSNANGNYKSTISASILTNPIITLVNHKLNGGVTSIMAEMRFGTDMAAIGQSDIAQPIINLLRAKISGGLIALKSGMTFAGDMVSVNKQQLTTPIFNFITSQINGGVGAYVGKMSFIAIMKTLTLPNPIIESSDSNIEQKSSAVGCHWWYPFPCLGKSKNHEEK